MADGRFNFNGSIDDVMIFNRSLSAGEVSALYANSSTKYLNATISGLSEGVHNYTVYTQDSAGNVDSSDLMTLIIDTILFTRLIVIISPANSDITTSVKAFENL